MGSWKMVRLGDVLEYEQPTKYIVQNTDYSDSYPIPVLTAGQTFILGYTDECDNIYRDTPVIIFDDFTTAIKYVDFPFKVKSSAMKILRPLGQVDLKYLFYYMTTIKTDTNLHKRYWISKYASIKLFLPPLLVQKQISDILDRASILIEQRNAQIEKLDLLVKSQFIQMFGDPIVNPKGWKTKKLADLIRRKSDLVDGPFGSSINTKTDYIENGEIPVIRTKNVGIFTFIPNDLKYMSREKYETVKRSQVIPGDIILTKVGTIGNICIFPSDFEEAVLSTTGSCRIRPDPTLINTKYLLQYLDIYRPQMLLMASTAVQAFLNMNHIKNFTIVVPPLSLQNEFAAFVEQVESQKTLLRQSLEKFELNYKSLMQKCFRGDIF